jgi:hypothetical protein
MHTVVVDITDEGSVKKDFLDTMTTLRHVR